MGLLDISSEFYKNLIGWFFFLHSEKLELHNAEQQSDRSFVSKSKWNC